MERQQREVTDVERQEVLAEKAREYGLTVDRLDEALERAALMLEKRKPNR